MKEEWKKLLGLDKLTGSILHAAKHTLRWGTYGPTGKDPLKFVPLDECNTEHLEMIICTQDQCPPIYRKVILAILKDRYRNGE